MNWRVNTEVFSSDLKSQIRSAGEIELSINLNAVPVQILFSTFIFYKCGVGLIFPSLVHLKGRSLA